MDSRETPAEYKDKFMLSFVEMGWADPTIVDPRHKGWTGGRVEIHTYESEFDIDEKHFCTPDTDEWRAFEEAYDLKWLTKIFDRVGELMGERIDQNKIFEHLIQPINKEKSRAFASAHPTLARGQGFPLSQRLR